MGSNTRDGRLGGFATSRASADDTDRKPTGQASLGRHATASGRQSRADFVLRYFTTGPRRVLRTGVACREHLRLPACANSSHSLAASQSK